MKFLVLSLLMILAPIANATCTGTDIIGEYTGDIMGGGVGSKTYIEFNEPGDLIGHYKMADYEQVGTFSELSLHNDVLSGIWTDEFGTDEFEFNFAPDCRSFEGNWNKSNGWNGKR